MAYTSVLGGGGSGPDQAIMSAGSMAGFAEAVVPFDVIGGFAFDDATLGPQQQARIMALARQLLARAIRAVRLVGHTDPAGSPDYNRGLGQRRADAVRRALMATLERIRPGSARQLTVTADSAGEMQPLSRSAVPAERARDRRVEVFLPVVQPVSPVPQPTAPVATSTQTIRIVVKSAILPVGPAVGTLTCLLSPLDVLPGGAALSTPVKLLAFGAMLDRVVSDQVTNDLKDGRYRLYSEQTLRVVCQDGQMMTVIPSPMDTDVGQECFLPSRGCITPPPLIVTGVTLRRTGPDSFGFAWTGKGRPHAAAEPAFQAICPRTSRFIWHAVSGSVRCGPGGVATVGLQLTGSRFPTHAAFVNGVARARIPQGTLSMLWDRHPADPAMVR